MVATNRVAPTIGDASIRILPDITGFGPQLSREIGQRSTLIAGAFGAALAAPLALSVGAAIEFERTFAFVRKTVDATEEEFSQLEEGIRDLATTLPATTTELNAIASVAGQLGVGVGQLEEFTETVAKLGVAAESIDADQAALQLARFVNITGGSLDDIDKLGASLVDLGNNFPALEGEILNFSQLIAGAGTTLGLTQADILGLSTSIASAGIRAERGGSSISRLILELQQASAQASPRLQVFADLMGLTAEGVQELVESDPGEAIVRIIENFGRLSEEAPADAIDVLDALNLNTIRVRDTMLRLGIAANVVRDAVDRGNTAFKEGTALETEYGKFAETASAQLQVLKNTLSEIFIEIGQSFGPAIQFLIDLGSGFLDFLQSIPTPVLTAITVLGGLSGTVIALGAAFLYSLQFVGRLLALFGPVRIAAGGLIPLLKSMAFTMTEYGTATAVAGRHTAGAVTGINAVRASATLATPAMFGLTASMGPIVVGIAALAAAGYLLYQRFQQISSTTVSVSDAVDSLSSSISPAVEMVKNFDGALGELEGDREVSVSFALENEEAINALRRLTEDSRESFGSQILFQLLIDGVPPEEAVRQVRKLFDAAGFRLPVTLDIENASDIVDELAGQGPAIAAGIEKFSGQLVRGFSPGWLSSFMTPELNIIEDDLDNLAQTLFDLAVTAESPAEARRLWSEFEEAIRDSSLSAQAQDDILSSLAKRFIDVADVAGTSTFMVNDMSEAMEQFNQIGVVNPFSVFRPNEFGQATEQIERVTSATTAAAAEANIAIDQSLIGWRTYETVTLSAADKMQIAIDRYKTAVTGDMEATVEAFRSGIPILSEYSSEVDLELQEATDSIVRYAQDEAKWQALREALTGRISEATLAAIESTSLPERAALSDAILGDSDSAREAALNWLATVEAVMTDPSALEGLDLSDFTITGDKAFTVLPEIDIDSPIRVPPSVREQVSDDIFETVESAFSEAGETGVFQSAEDLYRVAAQLGIEAYENEDPATRAIIESFTGLELPADVVSSLQSIGFDAASGVFEGFNTFGLADRIGEAIGGASSGSVVNRVRQVGRMSSPSRLFAERVGLPIAQGIAAGIDEGAPQVMRSMESLMAFSGNAPQPTLPASSPHPSLGVAEGLVQNITVNNPTVENLETSTKRALATARTAALLARPAPGLRRR